MLGDNGNKKFNPNDPGFLSDVGGGHIAEKLVDAGKIDEFLAMASVLDENEAKDFAYAIGRRLRYKQETGDLFALLKLKCAIGARRSVQFQQAITYVAESFKAYTDGKAKEGAEQGKETSRV